MNYGRKKAAEKRKDITSKSRMKKKRTGVRIFKGVLLSLLLLVIAGCVGGGIFIKKVIDDAPDITPDDVKPAGYMSVVLASDGKTETEKLTSAGSNRVYKTIDQIPKNLQHAFVAIEDERFYDHKGIDPKGIVRAGIIGITSGGDFSQGASTLTQQLIKNNVFDFMSENGFLDKLERKIQEQYLALKLEKQMSKNEIMENYLNTINLGQNTLGVQAASKRYFNKDVSQLTLSECSVIAAITQSPSYYNPITNPDNNAKRRKQVLVNMLEQGYISQAEYSEALKDDVYSRIQNVNTTITDTTPQSYFVDALIQQILNDLENPEIGLGYSETQAYNTLYKGGLSIYSTQDLEIQGICDQVINDDDNYPWKIEYGLSYLLTVTHTDGTQDNYSSGHIKKFRLEKDKVKYGLTFKSEDAAKETIEAFKASIAKEGDTFDEKITLSPQPQASVTVIDQKNGQIKAMVGGRGTKSSSMSLNRAYTGSKRQPGSCFKILAAYAPALDTAGDTLATIVKDEPYNYANGKPVSNWWGKSYRGNMTYRKAIEQSANICAVKVLTEITPQLGFDYCQKFGLSTVVESKTTDSGTFTDIQQSLALGGITDGVYNFEMCAAYAAIANGGVYQEPIMYTKILDHDGNVLIDRTKKQITRTVIKDSTAYLLTSAMEDVIRKGTGTPARLSNMAAAAKTGTTTSNVDLWIAGFTPYYTCTIWTGYDDNKPLADQEWDYHLKMWRKIMDQIDDTKGIEYTAFEIPDSIVRKSVCTKTGKLAVAGSCPSVTEYFDRVTAPTESCSGHAVPKKAEPENESGQENETASDSAQSGQTADSGSTDSGTSGTQTPSSGTADTGSSGNAGSSQTPPAGSAQ